MTEHPILFSAPMVRAILAGTKRMTRRIADLVIDGETTCDGVTTAGYEPNWKRGWGRVKPGDRLWVRETWGLHRYGDPTDWHRDSLKGGELPLDWELQLRADWGPCQEHCFWRPAIFMPRWASRITLEVTEVRAERLHSITDADAIAEGVNAQIANPAAEFSALWDDINGDRASWDSNPWVFVVSFRRLP